MNNRLEKFIEKARNRHGNKYDYSKVEYRGSKEKVCIICPKHGEFWQYPQDHVRGNNCPLCANENRGSKQRLTKEEFIKKAQEVHGNKYDYSMVNYKNANTKITIICPIHGEFEQIWNNHLRGEGCPKCNRSKGENKVINFLISKNINYVEQYRINIDKEINPSGYAFIDFYLPEYNIFIEYNGQQHYIAKDKFGGEIRFQQQLKRDQFVRDYCKNNQIKLIEIMYNENVNDKLIKEL